MHNLTAISLALPGTPLAGLADDRDTPRRSPSRARRRRTRDSFGTRRARPLR